MHPNPLHPTVASWPFEMWGTNIVGPFEPPASNGYRFILAATDYFSRWSEVETFKEIMAEMVIKFFQNNVLYRFGVPRRIISNNGPAYRNNKLLSFTKAHKIDWRFSSIYNPRANGLAEAFNKTLTKLLKKVVLKNKRNWSTKIPEIMWAYKTTYKTPTKATPYQLTSGTEAVLPLELQIPSLRIAIHEGLTADENAMLRLEELEDLDDKRLQAKQNLELYRARMSRAYDKLVRPRAFTPGELVLVLKRTKIVNRKGKGKFDPNWEGPYVIEEAYEGGAYQLVDTDGVRPMLPINDRYLKKYHA